MAFLGSSHARRLADIARADIRKEGHLNFGLRANTTRARGGLGADVRDDIVWLRPKANALSSAETKPAFAVVCFGTNDLQGARTTSATGKTPRLRHKSAWTRAPH